MSGPRRPHPPKQPLDCHDRALGLLAVRPRTRREMQARLLRAGFGADDVEDVLARLEAVGLLDDERFAREYAEHAVMVRRAGRRAIASSLLTRGVAPDVVQRAVEVFGEDEESRARDLARARAVRLSGLDPAASFRRLVAFLIRRGYDAGLARRVAREALGVTAAGE